MRSNYKLVGLIGLSITLMVSSACMGKKQMTKEQLDFACKDVEVDCNDVYGNAIDKRKTMCDFKCNKNYKNEAVMCTRDANEWGHPRSCSCDGYDEKTGKCGVTVVTVSSTATATSTNTSTTSSTGTATSAQITCTQDLNQYGHPTSCTGCKNAYDPKTGVCEKK